MRRFIVVLIILGNLAGLSCAFAEQCNLIQESEFVVSYKGVSFTVGDDPKGILNKIGPGSADEKNNFGFVGWDEEHIYKFYYHSYPVGNPVIRLITKLDIRNGKSIISQIDISKIGTAKGVKQGTDLKELEHQYGKPTKQSAEEGMEIYIYRLGTKSLRFYLTSNKVQQINIYLEQ